MPRPSPQAVGDEGRKDSIEIEEEEEGSAIVQPGGAEFPKETYKIPQTTNSIRNILD
jgi:hypothetical protein